MAILSSLHTGVSGLKAQGEAMGVIGDNIANSQTVGFKHSRAEFEDIMARSLKGVLGGNQIGRGVIVGAVNPILQQGTIDHTEKATDLAINGKGYFVVNGADGRSYTRDGSLQFDKDGFLTNNSGDKVMGYMGDGKGRIVNKLGDIKFPKSLVGARPTAKVNLEMNLDSRITDNKVFDAKNPYETSHYTTGVEVLDSQGNKHLVQMFFTKTADSQWEYHGMVDGKEIVGTTDPKTGEPIDLGPNGLAEVVTGKLTFTPKGYLDTEEQTFSNFNFAGGAIQNQKIEIDFGESITTDKTKGLSGTKQFGADSDILSWKQDGKAAGTIQNLSFNDEGILTVLYSNGDTEDIAQVALAKFDHPEKLFKTGNNKLKESRDSGTVNIGKAKNGGRGGLYAKSLERSTVDLAHEFVNLIQTQRAFQANAKTITTTDELLHEVINLKR